MRIPELLGPERIRCDLRSTSKKRVLESLSDLLAAPDPKVSRAAVFDALFARERLGSTGLGNGVALPHARLSSIQQVLGAFVKLAVGVDFDANDGQPVDLVFGLLVPQESTEEHLRILATLAELLRSESVRERLRATASSQGIWEILSGDTV